MRLVRLFLILLLSVALPFNNVAAATMAHCVQTSDLSQAKAAGDDADHAGQHAGHDAMAKHAQSGHSTQDASSQDGNACNHCSYCQACASAIVPYPESPVRADPPAKEIFLVAGQVTQSFLEQPFRPPRFALV